MEKFILHQSGLDPFFQSASPRYQKRVECSDKIGQLVSKLHSSLDIKKGEGVLILKLERHAEWV